MVFSSDQQELNLDVFQQFFIGRARNLFEIAPLQTTSRQRTLAYAFSAVLEALGWLSLGGAVGYFPRARADAEIAELAHEFAPGLENYAKDWSYLVNDFWLSEFRSMAATGKALAGTGDAASDEATRLFQSCMVRALRLTQSPSSEAAVMILDFDQVDDIATFIRTRLRRQSVVAAYNRRQGLNEKSGAIPLGAMYGGFGELVDCMDSLRSLQLLYANKSGQTINSLFRMIAQLMRWRFHFIAHSDLTDLQAEFINGFLAAVEITEPDRQIEYISFIGDLGKFWRNVQYKAAVA